LAYQENTFLHTYHYPLFFGLVGFGFLTIKEDLIYLNALTFGSFEKKQRLKDNVSRYLKKDNTALAEKFPQIF